MRKGIMSLEDLEAFTPVETNPNLGQELGEDRLGYQEAMGEVNSLQENIFEGSATAEAIEAMVEPLEAAGEPLTDAGAKALDIAVEHLCKRAGFPKRRIPAFEDYSGKKPTITLESLKTIGKAIWDAILKAFAKIKEWLKKAYAFIFGAEKKIEAKAKKNIDAIKKHQHAEPAVAKTFNALVEEIIDSTDAFKNSATTTENGYEQYKAAKAPESPAVAPAVVEKIKSLSMLDSNKLASFFGSTPDKVKYTIKDITRVIESYFSNSDILFEAIDHSFSDVLKGDGTNVDRFKYLYSSINSGLAKMSVKSVTYHEGTPLIISLPFEKELVVVSKNLKSSFSFKDYETSEEPVAIRLATLDDGLGLALLTLKHSTTGADLLKKLEDSYEKIDDALDAKFRELSELEESEQKHNTDLSEDKLARQNNIGLWEELRSFVTFTIQIVSALLQYKNKILTFVNDWVEKSYDQFATVADDLKKTAA